MQPLSTSCPQCNTRFRVFPEQLAARQGLVRCGNCATVFNGFADLRRGEIDNTSDSHKQSPLVDKTILTTAIQDLSGRVEATPPPLDWAPVIEHKRDAEESAATPSEIEKAEVWNKLHGHIDQPPPHVSWMPADSALTSDEEPANTTIADETTHDINAINAITPEEPGAKDSDLYPNKDTSPVVASGNSTALATGPNPAELSITAEQAEQILLPPNIYEPARTTHRGAIALSLFLLMTLAAQAAYKLRTEIAVRWPAVKPYMLSLCQPLRCTVPLPQEIDQLTIESSETQVDPERPNVMLVTALLRNHSARPQNYPLLEVTLTDALDRTVARRSLSAAEYLGVEPKYDEGIPPNSETITHAGLEATDIKPTGYRLRLYYR